MTDFDKAVAKVSKLNQSRENVGQRVNEMTQRYSQIQQELSNKYGLEQQQQDTTTPYLVESNKELMGSGSNEPLHSPNSFKRYNPTLGETAVDTAKQFVSGSAKAVDGVVTLGDVVLSGYVNMFDAENAQVNRGIIKDTLGHIGYRPHDATQIIDDSMSEPYKNNLAHIQESNSQGTVVENFFGALKDTLTTPSVAIPMTGQSLPIMFAGSAIGQGLTKAGTVSNALTANAIGHGVMGTANHWSEQSHKGNLTSEQGLAGLGFGAVIGGTIRLGSAIAGGKGDIDSIGTGLGKGNVRDVIKSGLVEIPEEASQTLAERALTDIADGKEPNYNQIATEMGIASGSTPYLSLGMLPKAIAQDAQSTGNKTDNNAQGADSNTSVTNNEQFKNAKDPSHKDYNPVGALNYIYGLANEPDAPDANVITHLGNQIIKDLDKAKTNYETTISNTSDTQQKTKIEEEYKNFLDNVYTPTLEAYNLYNGADNTTAEQLYNNILQQEQQHKDMLAQQQTQQTNQTNIVTNPTTNNNMSGNQSVQTTNKVSNTVSAKAPTNIPQGYKYHQVTHKPKDANDAILIGVMGDYSKKDTGAGSGDHFDISIYDNGKGIKGENPEKYLDRFSTVNGNILINLIRTGQYKPTQGQKYGASRSNGKRTHIGIDFDARIGRGLYVNPNYQVVGITAGNDVGGYGHNIIVHFSDGVAIRLGHMNKSGVDEILQTWGSNPTQARANTQQGGTSTNNINALKQSTIKQLANGRWTSDDPIMARIIAVESMGDANADRGNTQYLGLMQMGANERKQFGITNPFDAQQNFNGAKKYILQNVEGLKKAGIPINATTIYLAHNQGLGGLKQIWQSSQGKGSISTEVRSNMNNNGGKGKTAKQFLDYWEQRLESNYQDFIKNYGGNYVGLPSDNAVGNINTNQENNQSTDFSDYFKSLMEDNNLETSSENTSTEQNQVDEIKQSENNIIQNIMRNYSKFTIEQIDNLTILSDSQKSLLRNLIETKGKLATHKNMNDVSKNFFNGEKGQSNRESNRGVDEYVELFDRAIETGNAQTATYLMSDLERFAHSHQSKAETMAKAFNSVDDGETLFIAPDKKGNWNIVTGFDEDTIREYGGLKVNSKSGKLLSFIQNESSILNQLRDSYKPVLQGLIQEKYSPKQRVQSSISPSAQTQQQVKKGVTTTNTNTTSPTPTVTQQSNQQVLDLERGKDEATGKQLSLSAVKQDKTNIGKQGWLAMPYNISDNPTNSWQVKDKDEQVAKYVGLIKELSQDDDFVKGLIAEKGKQVKNGGVANKVIKSLLSGLPDDVAKAKRYITNFNHTDSSINTLFSSYDKFDNDLAETNTDKSYVVDADVSDKNSHENVILAKTQRKDKHGVDTFSDSNPNSKKLVDSFIKRLAEERDKGQELVFPKNGVSKHLETSAPKTYAYLNQRLKDEFGYDNTQRVFEDKPTDKERSAVVKGSSKNTKTARPAMRSKVKVPKLKPSELKQREEDYLNALNDDAGYFTSGIENLDGINQAVEDYLNGNTEYESNKEFIDSLGLGKTLSNILNHYIQARQYGYEDISLNDLFNMGSEDLKALAQERFNEVDDKEIKLDEEKEIETEVFGDVTLPTQLINNKVVLDNVLDLLQHIEDNRVSKNEKKYHLELIDGLLNYSPDYQIELIKQDSKEIHDYDEKTKTMKIYLPVNGGNIFELISRGLIQSTNAQVLNDLDSKDARKLNRELDKIRDVINVYIRDNNPEFDANTTYLLNQALENNTGLIAVGLSSKGVIDFLKQVKTEEKNVKTNLFRRLVRAISDFIGMTNGKETQNLYERLVELSAQASNLQNTTVDKDLYKASEDGKLTVLQNISDNDVQKELNKDFEYRNHLISAFTQQTGKGKPLASIKDVLGKLRLNLTQGLQALHSTLPTKAQREQVKDFINFQQEFVGHLQDTFRAKQKTDKGDFGYQDLKTFLAVDGEIDENVYTAMSLAVYDYIIENGNHTMNTDKDIKKLLNLESEDDSYIPKEVREQYRYLGEPSAWSANKIGQSIIKSLGLKHNGLSNPELQSRLEMSVGQWAINAMQSADLVHIHTMKTEDHFNNIINAGGEVPQEFNAEGVVHFMSVTDAKGLNHNPLLTEIVSKNFGTKGYLAEVFGFESRLTYPKLEKPTEVRLKIKGTDSVVTQEQERLLKRVQEEPVQLVKETVDSIQYLYEHFNDDLLEMFGASVSEEKLKYMHIDDRDGEIAGAEAKLRGLQNALGFISSLDKDEQGNYQEFYLPTYVAKNTRWHFDSNVFNFQTDKIHRAMGEYKSFKSDIDTDGVLVSDNHLNYIPEAFFNEDGTTTDLTRFFRALGENLEGTEKFIKAQDVNKLYAQGYTVDKMASIDFIPSLISWFNQDEVKQAVEATKVLLDKPSELKQEHINSIKKFIDMGEMGAGSYRALIEYTRFIQAVEQGKPFTTSLGLGSDGINNGSAISYTLNGALDISPSFAYQVGLIMKTDEQDIDNYFDTRYDHNIGDYYESFAKQIKDYLESSEHPLVKAIQAVHKSASGRKLAKDVLIPFGYSAGIGRISQITLGRFLKDIRDAQVDLAVKYMKLQERKESDTVTDEDYILQMAKLDEDYNALQDNLRVMLGKDYNLPKYEEMLETSLDGKHGRKLTKIYNEHMNKPLGDMLNEYADKFIVTRNKNIAMHETMYGIYQSAYQSFESRLRQKYYQKYKAEIKRKNPELDDIKLQQEVEKKIDNIGFTQQEIEEEILKPIAKLIPKVDSPFSFIHNETERESRFDAFKWVKELVNKDNIETIGYQYNEQGELQASSTQLPLVQKILESTGVFTNSAQTQGSDAYITTFTSADSKDVVINVHDADIGGIKSYIDMAIKQNEMFFKGMAQYHANLASVIALENTINNLLNLDDSIENINNTIGGILVDTLNGLFKGDRNGFLDQIYNFKGDPDSETYAEDKRDYIFGLLTHEESRDKILSAVISYVALEAKEADLAKLNQLKNLHAVHQYGGEDGQYYITDADRKLIDEQIEAVEKAYAKFDKYNTHIDFVHRFKYEKSMNRFIESILHTYNDETSSNIGNVNIIDGLDYKNGVAKAKAMGGIYSMRLPNTDKHFGNPFTPSKELARKQGLKYSKNAVKDYMKWVLMSEDERAFWVREQVNSGVLHGKPILYYKDLGRLSHANGLDFIINKLGYIPYVDKPEPLFNSELVNSNYNPTEVEKPTSMADITNHTGGAYGSDTSWDLIGRGYGVIKHNHYRGSDNVNVSKPLKAKGVKAIVLSKEQLNQARNEVNNLLGKQYKDDITGNLQARNYYQVSSADSVFAIASLTDNKKAVTGGTNTAIQLAIKLNKPVYVFDLVSERWYTFNGKSFVETPTPTLSKNFAGVGTRDIALYPKGDGKGNFVSNPKYLGDSKRDVALQAIRDVYENTQKSISLGANNQTKQTKQDTVLGLHEQLEKIINSNVSQDVKDKAQQLLSYDNDYDVERKSLGQGASDYILSKDKIIINSFGLSGNQGALEFINRLERALKEIYSEDVTNEEVIQPKATQEDLNTFIQQLLSEKGLDKPQAPVLNYLMGRVAELNPNLSFGFADDVNGYAYYDLNQNVIRFNRKEWLAMKANEKAGLVIHELYHSLTDLMVYKYKTNPSNVSKTQRDAYELLEQMRETTRQKLLDSNQLTDKLEYATSSINEFIAHGMSDPNVKQAIAKHTQGIKQTKTTRIKDGLRAFFNAVSDFFGFNKNENKAYKDFIQAVSQLETKYKKPSTQLQISYSKYSTATDKVNSLSAVEVLKSLDATGLDENHNNHLDSIITTVIGGYYDKNETNKKKVDKSVKKLQSKPLNHGFSLTDKEAYVYAILEEISYEYLKSQAGNLPTSELHKVYDEVSRQFTSVDKLYDGFNVLSKDEQSLLRKKYNFVFGAKNANKPHRFMALTLASQEFRELMNQDRKRVNKKSDTWFSKVMNYLIGALNIFKDNQLGKTNKDAVTSLMAKLSQIDVQGRNRLDDLVATSWNFLTSPLYKVNTYASKAVIKSLDLVNIEKLKKLRDITKTTVAFGGNFTTKAWLNNFTRRASNNKQPLNFIGELLNEMSATTAMKSYIEGMLRHTQYLGKQRSQIKTATKNVLNSLFKSELSAQQRHAITVGLLRTDVSSLFDYYNKPTVRKLLLDTDLRQEEIEKLYQRIEANENGNDMIKQAKSLAYYMVSERAVEHLVKNPTGIAMGLNTNYVDLENTPNQQLIKDLDALISLLALEYVPVQQQSILFDLFSEEDNALFEVLHLHKGMIDTAKEEFADNPLNIAKGYLPQITNRYKSISFANPEEVTELENNGWVRINDDVLHQDPSDNTGERVLMFHDDMSYRSYVSGALDMIDTANKGTTVYTFNQHQGELNVAMGEKRQRILNRKHISHRDYDPVKQPTAMISSFDSEGYVTGLRYEMSGFLRDNYLQRDNDFAEVLSTYMGQQFYKTNINEHQHNLLDGIYADYKTNFRKQSKEFITISGESNDPEMQRVWRMLPYSFRQNAKDKFGSNVVVIRSTVFNATFGFKAYSIADMFDKVFEDKNVLEKILTGILSAVFGDKAKAKTLKAERLIEYLTGQAKDFIVIRSGQVLLGNIISNLLLLGLSGINPLQLVKEFSFAWKNGKVYADIEKRLAEVNAEILAKGDKSELLKERNRLQQQLKDNPLREFMQAGLMSTIVEDVEQETDIEKYSKSVYEEKLDKFVNHVPKPIRTIFDYATLNTNTEPYKFLSEATQFSDFGAKIVLARHLMKQGKSLNEAISVAQDHFINYDVPTSRGLDYMNRVGLMMFTKFFLRFQKIMFNLLHKKLATSVIQHNLVENLTDFQGIYEPFMLNRFGNPFEMPVHTYFTSIDDILTFKLFS